MTVGKRKQNRYKFVLWSMIFALLVSIIPPLQGKGSIAVTEKKNLSKM
ncbi:hypothetical protein [Peribacillus simplex]|jgi:hypothetical protein|nr:hypothetical protein [Peribacillus simplex]